MRWFVNIRNYDFVQKIIQKHKKTKQCSTKTQKNEQPHKKGYVTYF